MENTRYISGAAAAMDGSAQHHDQHITAVWQHGFATALAWHMCQSFLVLFPLLQIGVQQALDLFF